MAVSPPPVRAWARSYWKAWTSSWPRTWSVSPYVSAKGRITRFLSPSVTPPVPWEIEPEIVFVCWKSGWLA